MYLSMRSSLRLRQYSPSTACRCAFSTLPRPYTFHIGASWVPKPPDDSVPGDRNDTAAEDRKRALRSFPKESEKGRWRDRTLVRWGPSLVGRHQGEKELVEDEEHAMGEDFLFMQEMRGNSGTAVGVADGVGGWITSGVDPSLFSQALMYYCHHLAERSWAFPPDVSESEDIAYSGEGWEARRELGEEVMPQGIMQFAFDSVQQDPDVEMGASTACIVTLNSKTGRIRAANLGDSGFAIIRSSALHHIQSPQTHYFNCPKQLSKYPRGRRFRGSQKPLLDHPHDADVYECTLRHGDILLLYTDGLADNVFPSELLELSSLILRSPLSSSPASADVHTEQARAQLLAESCALHARRRMMDFHSLTPFEAAAKEDGGWAWRDWHGGKIDDVTVIAVLVTEGM